MDDDLAQLLKKHRPELGVAARSVQLTTAFDLSLTVGLLLGGRCVTTTLSGLPKYLPTSTAASTELFERFLLLRAERGWDHAWDTLANGEEGEEWCSIWDEVVADKAGGSVLTADQLTNLVVNARAGFLHSPKELLVINKEEGGGVVSVLCDVGWFS